MAATSTREALVAQRTQSVQSTATQKAYLALFERVNIQDITSYPGSYSGKKIIVRAEVSDILDDGANVRLWLYSWAGHGYMTAFMQTPLTPKSGVREGYDYYVYGTVVRCPSDVSYNLDGYCLDDAFIPSAK